MPELPYALKVVVILVSGVALLRLAGKRSISQLSVPEAVLMIAIGTLLIQPLAPETEWGAIYGGALLVAGMVFLSFLQIWFIGSRKWVFGVPSAVVRNGQVDVKELKKCRMTMDQLEMRLRQLKVGNMLDVKEAVLEPSGELSVVLSENKKSAEKGDIQIVLDQFKQLSDKISSQSGGFTTTKIPDLTQYSQDALFDEAEKEDQQNANLKM